MDDAAQTLKWGIRRRLEFIDFRLFWDGRFNRKNLSDVFGISAQQASTDIAQYEQIAPTNLEYDRVEKAYLRTANYKPAFIGEFSDRYLLQLVAIENNWMRSEDTWFDQTPAIEVVSLKRSPTNPTVLLNVLDAIRDNKEIDIQYLSMTGSTAAKRTIAPHSLAYCASRWYVRAWSRDHNDFRDYNLNRIREVSALRANQIDKKLDFEWHHKINLIMAPNPKLSIERQRAVAEEFSMIDLRLSLPTRLSLAFFVMSENNFDVDPDVLKPEKQQLVLLNAAEVAQARAAARQLSIEALEREGSKSA